MSEAPAAWPLLSRIESPADLRRLAPAELPAVAAELRDFLIRSVARCGGHFGASLGAVELTVALHYIFRTPEDRLVWDVGHQGYGHKVLTGRRDALETIRRRGGLAPFPSRHESAYDCFGVGHSSTAISAALGMALAAARAGAARKAVAVVGDGGMTAGLAYEALNHLGESGADVLVVLNDNRMSIAPNVGAMSRYLTRLLAGRVYGTVREGGKRALRALPAAREFARRMEEHVKGMLMPGTLFEEMGLQYFGPVDGHDLPGLLRVLAPLRERAGPRLLHVVTRKGKGYPPAEADPVGYHAVPRFDPAVGVRGGAGPAARTYSRVFGDWLCDQAAADPRLLALTPAMGEGSGLARFAREHPTRYFDVGIAEQHAVAVAAGMACEGRKPVVAIYSTFLQRAYDQLIHDVAVQDLDVLFAVDRAGPVGADGPTHAGSFDLSYLRCVPNLAVLAPADENECRLLLSTAYRHPGPAAVRYPRGAGPGAAEDDGLGTVEFGRARVVRAGRGTAILSFGSLLAQARPAAEELDATLVDMRFVKPLDAGCVARLAAGHGRLVTLEDNALAGGAGAAVAELLAGGGPPLLRLGLPDRFLAHGTRAEQLAEAGLDAGGIRRALVAAGAGRAP